MVVQKIVMKFFVCFGTNRNYKLVRIPYTKLGNIILEDLFGDKYLIKESDF